MPIHEKSLIRPENLVEHESLVIDGVDVSGHWSTFIETRAISDYNENMQDEIEALAGGEHISALLAMRLLHQFLHRQRDQSRLQSALLDLSDPPGHGGRTGPRQGHHLAVRELQQMHLCVPARRQSRRGDEGDGALAGTQGPYRKVAVHGLRRGLFRAGLQERQDRGRPCPAAILQAARARSCSSPGWSL